VSRTHCVAVCRRAQCLRDGVGGTQRKRATSARQVVLRSSRWTTWHVASERVRKRGSPLGLADVLLVARRRLIPLSRVPIDGEIDAAVRTAIECALPRRTLPQRAGVTST
jgi:hypothetical protein